MATMKIRRGKKVELQPFCGWARTNRDSPWVCLVTALGERKTALEMVRMALAGEFKGEFTVRPEGQHPDV
jgi:hypothetical protein